VRADRRRKRAGRRAGCRLQTSLAARPNGARRLPRLPDTSGSNVRPFLSGRGGHDPRIVCHPPHSVGCHARILLLREVDAAGEIVPTRGVLRRDCGVVLGVR
jgi:hypothetical protein